MISFGVCHRESFSKISSNVEPEPPWDTKFYWYSSSIFLYFCVQGLSKDFHGVNFYVSLVCKRRERLPKAAAMVNSGEIAFQSCA